MAWIILINYLMCLFTLPTERDKGQIRTLKVIFAGAAFGVGVGLTLSCNINVAEQIARLM